MHAWDQKGSRFFREPFVGFFLNAWCWGCSSRKTVNAVKSLAICYILRLPKHKTFLYIYIMSPWMYARTQVLPSQNCMNVKYTYSVILKIHNGSDVSFAPSTYRPEQYKAQVDKKPFRLKKNNLYFGRFFPPLKMHQLLQIKSDL